MAQFTLRIEVDFLKLVEREPLMAQTEEAHTFGGEYIFVESFFSNLSNINLFSQILATARKIKCPHRK